MEHTESPGRRVATLEAVFDHGMVVWDPAALPADFDERHPEDSPLWDAGGSTSWLLLSAELPVERLDVVVIPSDASFPDAAGDGEEGGETTEAWEQDLDVPSGRLFFADAQWCGRAPDAQWTDSADVPAGRYRAHVISRGLSPWARRAARDELLRTHGITFWTHVAAIVSNAAKRRLECFSADERDLQEAAELRAILTLRPERS